MSILWDDAEKFLKDFCLKMDTKGHARWEEVGNQLGYDREKSAAIRRELHQKKWIRPLASDVDKITRSGLTKVKDMDVLSPGEYYQKLEEIFGN